ncbi:hypothetical protein ACWELV_30595 [Streptomyces mirabilis]
MAHHLLHVCRPPRDLFRWTRHAISGFAHRPRVRPRDPDLEEQLTDGTRHPADESETSHTGLETTLVELHGVRPGVRRP